MAADKPRPLLQNSLATTLFLHRIEDQNKKKTV